MLFLFQKEKKIGNQINSSYPLQKLPNFRSLTFTSRWCGRVGPQCGCLCGCVCMCVSALEGILSADTVNISTVLIKHVQ